MDSSSPIDDESMGNDVEVSMVTALWEFLNRRSTSHDAVNQLMRFLQADPAFATPDTIIPLDEMQTRLELIETTRQIASIPGQRYQLNFLQLAYLSLIPASDLPEFEFEDRYWCLRIKHKEHKISFKNLMEKDECLVRDRYTCVLTGAAYPEVCHIIPFAVNSSRANAAYSMSCLDIPGLMSDSFTRERLYRLLTPEAGCSDKSWNMICLTPTLYSWWRQCLFALKCIAVTTIDEYNAKIRLQFHWMPRNKVNPHAPAEPLRRDIEAMMFTMPEPHGAIIGDTRRGSSRPLETGQTFEISMSPEQAFNMKVMIDVQWVMVRLAAISGLARSWETRDDYVDHTSWF
ncbi:hypothetical protein TrVGV298_007882 [Trichoderma virens]|nr:hypothetical protein TrVGV298_007882 [Trichoderma virens]